MCCGLVGFWHSAVDLGMPKGTKDTLSVQAVGGHAQRVKAVLRRQPVIHGQRLARPERASRRGGRRVEPPGPKNSGTQSHRLGSGLWPWLTFYIDLYRKAFKTSTFDIEMT